VHAVILASREGWHTQELTRALAARGHAWDLVPYEGLTASLGGRPGLRSGAAELDRADVVLPRIIPAGSLEQIGERMLTVPRVIVVKQSRAQPWRARLRHDQEQLPDEERQVVRTRVQHHRPDREAPAVPHRHQVSAR
jgi:hypothetical protein